MLFMGTSSISMVMASIAMFNYQRVYGAILCNSGECGVDVPVFFRILMSKIRANLG